MLNEIPRNLRYDPVDFEKDNKKGKETFVQKLKKIDIALMYNDFVALFRAPSSQEYVRKVEELFDSQMQINQPDV